MLFQNLLFAAALSASALAIDVDNDEVPYQCRDVCLDIVTLTKKCDAQTYGPNDDAAELSCICNAPNAKTQIPLCEACVSQFDEDGTDNDVNDLVRKCGFAYTTYNTASPSVSSSAPSTSAAQSAPPSSSAPASSSSATTSPAPSSSAPVLSTGTGSSAAPTGGYNATGSGAPTPPFGSPSQSGGPQVPTGAARANGVGAFGLSVGVLGFVLGVM